MFELLQLNKKKKYKSWCQVVIKHHQCMIQQHIYWFPVLTVVNLNILNSIV